MEAFCRGIELASIGRSFSRYRARDGDDGLSMLWAVYGVWVTDIGGLDR